MTTAVTEEQYNVIKQYSDLLITVEEAFHYIIEGFGNYERTEGDLLLADVFTALSQIAQTNEQLVKLFPDEIMTFNEIVKNVELLADAFHNQELKQQIIKDKLYPAFTAWSTKIQEQLKPLLTV